MPIITPPSVMSLYLSMQFKETKLSTGTGFLVASKTGLLLVTNRHNVTGRHQETNQPISEHGGVPDRIQILHNSCLGLGNWIWHTELLYGDDGPLWFEHPVQGKSYDFVALPLSNTEEIQSYPYDTRNTGPDIVLVPSDTISVVGFPFGNTYAGGLATWVSGFIATEIDLPHLPTFLIDCRARPGQSGSAVISYNTSGIVNGKDGSKSFYGGATTTFMGIYSGRIRPNSDIGIVWKASVISELVDAIDEACVTTANFP